MTKHARAFLDQYQGQDLSEILTGDALMSEKLNEDLKRAARDVDQLSDAERDTFNAMVKSLDQMVLTKMLSIRTRLGDSAKALGNLKASSEACLAYAKRSWDEQNTSRGDDRRRAKKMRTNDAV